MHRHLGPTDIFSNAMGSPIARKTKTIKVIDGASFTILELMFPAGTAGASSPETVALYPVLSEIQDVKRFQLASGTIQAIYYI